MFDINSQSQGDIRLALVNAMKKYRSIDTEAITDFFVQVAFDSGDMIIYDDEDNVLAKTIIGEWADHKDEDDIDLLATIKSNIIREIVSLDKDGTFNNVMVMKPFSFVMIDDDKEVIEDLYLVDEENMILSSELMMGLDEDLDVFMKNLLDV
ncbi:MAG: hypothetical protein MJZ20_03885 [Bacteroidaceae bacterium]|nr:hypothetical protein [Bacteroidaceae bacterium]